MHCFYIEPPKGGTALLLSDESRHSQRVLRLSVGDEICAMDGAGGRFRAAIEAMGEDGVRVRLMGEMPAGEAPVRVSVYQGLPKSDKLELIAQKLTELGAAALVPVKMERCVARSDDKGAHKRLDRLTRIAREAAKQCQRALPPEITLPLTWPQAIERMAAHDLLLVPWEEASGRRMKDAFAVQPEARDIGIVIGPEGGMTGTEVQALVNIGASVITLGPRILRTETASVTSAALAMSLWGDL